MEKSFCYKKIKITLREKRMVKLAMYSLLIVITFFGVGAFSGKLFVKFPDREQREENAYVDFSYISYDVFRKWFLHTDDYRS